MKSDSTVIFLDYFDTLEKAVPFIRRVCVNLKSKPVIISSNFDTTPLAIYPDLQIIYFDKFLSSEDYAFMDRYVFNLTQTWYAALRPVEGITRYKGVEFGEIEEEGVQRFFTSTVKKLEIILKIKEHFNPYKIILIGERDNFQNLSKFIKEELNISTLFIDAGEKGSFLKATIEKFRNCGTEILSNLFDSLMRRAVMRKKGNNGIFIDAHLCFELSDLSKEFHPYLYLIEKGLRIRLGLFKRQRFLFVPVTTENVFKLPNVFSPYYRYWKSIKTDAPLKNKFIYKNLLFWGLLEGFVRKLIVYNFSHTNKNIRFLERLYNVLAPKAVVLREAVRKSERIIALTAKQAGIPTLVIQHGLLAERHVYTKLYPDKIALWGKAGIEWYGAYGNNISKCIVTGKPSHDLVYFKKDDYEKISQEALLKIGADPTKETILYIASFFKDVEHLICPYYFKDSEYMALGSILKIVQYFPEKQWIIKMHPFDLIGVDSLLNAKLKTKYPNVFVTKDVNIIHLIKNSSLVISSLFSSAALDAVIFNKPVITLNFYKREDLIPFAQRGVALSVSTPEELYEAVKRIFVDKKLRDYFASNRKSFIYDYACNLDGKSTQRVINLIKKACNKSNFSENDDIENTKSDLTLVADTFN